MIQVRRFTPAPSTWSNPLSPSQQPSLLRPAGPDGGRTSCLPPLLRGGGLRQLGAAPPRLLRPGTHPAPVGSGGSRLSPVVPVGRQPPPPPVRPEPRQPPAPLRGGAVVTSQRQDGGRGRPAATRCTFRWQGHLIDRLWVPMRLRFQHTGCSCLAVKAQFWLTANCCSAVFTLQMITAKWQLRGKTHTDSRLVCCLHFPWFAAAHQHQDTRYFRQSW